MSTRRRRRKDVMRRQNRVSFRHVFELRADFGGQVTERFRKLIAAGFAEQKTSLVQKPMQALDLCLGKWLEARTPGDIKQGRV